MTEAHQPDEQKSGPSTPIMMLRSLGLLFDSATVAPTPTRTTNEVGAPDPDDVVQD